MVCPIHEVNYTFVCPYCQARKIAELEGEGELTEGDPPAWSAIRALREFEEAENTHVPANSSLGPLKESEETEWPDIISDGSDD